MFTWLNDWLHRKDLLELANLRKRREQIIWSTTAGKSPDPSWPNDLRAIDARTRELWRKANKLTS